MQKRSYESINSLGGSTITTAVHTAQPTPIREIIVTPTESLENLREEEGGLAAVKTGKEARPTSVGTVAFGAP